MLFLSILDLSGLQEPNFVIKHRFSLQFGSFFELCHFVRPYFDWEESEQINGLVPPINQFLMLSPHLLELL